MMMLLFNLCLWALLLPLVLACGVVLVQVLRCPLQLTVAAPLPLLRPTCVVLVPAHDEADGITATLQQLRTQLAPGDRLLVVADNCTDATARLARDAGAEVVERHDPARRGKGYALAHGVAHLRHHPPEVVLIVDADCHVEPGGLAHLAAAAQASGRPVQALYLMHPPPQASLKQRVSAFAWRVRNGVRPGGWHRLGLPCQLMGSGMAFPWPLLQQATLAHADLVEDMKLGIDLAMAGHPPCFVPQAVVHSQFPESGHAAQAQRTRWEHGHLATLLRECPRMLKHALRQRDKLLAAQALDLMVPPLALLAVLLLLANACTVWWALMVGDWMPAAVAGLTGLGWWLAMVLAWSRHGRDLVAAREWGLLPGYLLSKVPLYVRFVVRRERKWVRTDRR